MNCPICKVDITETRKQFGNVRHPLCLSCHLAGYAWVQDAPDILEHLEAGKSLEDALLIENRKHNDEMTEGFLEIMHDLSIDFGAHD